MSASEKWRKKLIKAIGNAFEIREKSLIRDGTIGGGKPAKYRRRVTQRVPGPGKALPPHHKNL